MAEYLTNSSLLLHRHQNRKLSSVLQNHTREKTDENCSRNLDALFWVINGFMGVVILFGNSLTCAAFLRLENLRRSSMNQFLLSLSVCDVLMGVLVPPGYASFCIGCSYRLSQLCWVFVAAKDVCFLASTLNVLAISYDRYSAVFQPLKYQVRMSGKAIAVILSTVWVTPVCIASIRNIWTHSQPSEVVKKWNREYSSFVFIAFVIIPITIVSIINISILRAIRRQRLRITLHSDATRKPRRKEYLQQYKGTLSCVLVMIIFIVCWLPRAFYFFLHLFDQSELVTPLLLKMSVTFVLFQSSTNPLIYSFCRREFRRALKLLMKCQ